MKRNQMIEEWMHDYATFLMIVHNAFLLGIWCFFYGASCLKWWKTIQNEKIICYLYTIGTCILILSLFTMVYEYIIKRLHGDRIACYQLQDTIISQVIAVIPFEIILLNTCESIWTIFVPKPLIKWEMIVAFVLLEIILILTWAWYGKRYVCNHLKPYRTLVIAGDALGSYFAEKMQESLGMMYQIQMYVTDDKEQEIIRALIRMHDVVILYNVEKLRADQFIQYCEEKGKIIYLSSEYIRKQKKNTQVIALVGEPFVDMTNDVQQGYSSKRFWDICIGTVLCISCIPFMIIFGVIQYIQTGKIFENKTMILHNGMQKKCYDFSLKKNKDDEENSFYGFSNVLYKTGWYRMPELLAVMKGHMHLVGPVWTEENTLYTNETITELLRERKHITKYGILGYTNLFPENNWSFSQAPKYNKWYLQEESFDLDCTIILLHIKRFLLMIIEKRKDKCKKKEYRIN